MKLRTGFVSNSSSTSFLIISKGKLTKKGLRELMGVEPGSILTPLFDELYKDLLGNVKAELDLGQVTGKRNWAAEIGIRSVSAERSNESEARLQSAKGKDRVFRISRQRDKQCADILLHGLLRGGERQDLFECPGDSW